MERGEGLRSMSTFEGSEKAKLVKLAVHNDRVCGLMGVTHDAF
jgi:hypothetical protein